MQHKILIVDDDPGLLKLLSLRLSSAGYIVETAGNAMAALACMSHERPAVVITDLRMDGMDGMSLLQELHVKCPGLPVLMLTAHGTIPEAVHATQNGAFAFLTKPVNKDELLSQIGRAIKSSGITTENEDLQTGIVTRSTKMLELLAQVRLVAKTDSSVLITGASGTGKELVARALHEASPRTTQRFVALNCAAVPENLMEAELFGYERGAFTGASRNHLGLLQAAQNGTLFLDEIGDMPLHLQAKLLRVLQERKVRQVGGLRDIDIDVRVLSATHSDLQTAVATGKFREDLYYRINVVTLQVPPLSERREDIPLLVQHMLGKLATRQHAVRKVYAPEAMELLVKAEWPGNVRQLLNVVEQNFALSPSTVISTSLVEKALGSKPDSFLSFDEARTEFTRHYLSQLLQLTDGNVTRAAKLAHRNRTDFYKLLHKHGLEPERFKHPSQSGDNLIP
ncbi:MAG TPA: sigma 54-interacting transcriptional regulator [Gammaproteobacteria bacterium]